mgnify:CR=1 FL=1
MTCIYKISSTVKPERFYIGSAKNFNVRIGVHKCQLIKNNHHSVKLQRHVNKYGLDDLAFTVLEVCSFDGILKREQYYIDSLNPYFNSNPIAGSNQGRVFGKMRKEHAKKISESLKGRKNTAASDKLSKGLLKYDIDGNLIKKYKSLSQAITEEGVKIKTFSSINKTIGGYVWVTEGCPIPDFNSIRNDLSNWRKEKMKPVLQVDKSGSFIMEYNGVREASRITGIDHRSIQSVASASNPNRKTAGGYLWVYKKVA